MSTPDGLDRASAPAPTVDAPWDAAEVVEAGSLEELPAPQFAPAPPATIAIPSMRSNFAWTLAGNMFYAGCQWTMISALAKLGSAEVVGNFTFGLAVSAPIFMFTNMQLRSVQATDARGEAAFYDYFTLRMLATLVGLLAIVALLPFEGTSSTVRMVVLLISLSKAIECISDVTAGLLQRAERLDRVAISLMMRGVGALLAFAAVYAWTRSLLMAVSGLVAAWLAVLLLYDVPNSKRLLEPGDGFFRFDGARLRRLMMQSMPLGWVATLLSLNTNIPRYLLQHRLGAAEQGIYASLAYLIVVINLIVMALGQSATTRLARMFADGELRQFRMLLFKLSMFGVVIAAAGVPLCFLIGRPVLTLLYRAEYGDHVGLLALFVGTAGLSTIGSFLFCGVSAARSFRAQVPVYFVALVVGVAGAALLIPRFGLIGAGLGLLLSAATVAGGGLWVVRSVLAASRAQHV